jgi:hypothetical protein
MRFPCLVEEEAGGEDTMRGKAKPHGPYVFATVPYKLAKGAVPNELAQ